MSTGASGKKQLGVYELYRYAHADGTSKDWAIALIDGAVDTRFGKTGAPLQGGPVERRLAGPHAEVRRRIDQKLSKGYRRVGEVVMYEDGTWELAEKASPTPVPAPEKEADRAYFEIRLLDAGAWSVFLARCQEACRTLSASGVPVKSALTGDKFNAAFAVGDWPLEVADRSAGSRNTVSRSTREGAGHVLAREGVYPLLFLLYLKRFASEHTYEVGVAVKDGIEVTEKLHHEQDVLAMFGVSLDDIRPIAVALGLAEEKIDLASVGSEESMYF